MELLYVLIGGALVIAGFMLAKYEPGMFKRSKAKEMTFVEPEADDRETNGKSNKKSVEEQLAAMQGYDPLRAAKKGAFEDED